MMTFDAELAALNQLYARIPAFPCARCAECCGPIQWSEVEDVNIRRYLAEHDMEFRMRNLDVLTVVAACHGVKEAKDACTCPYAEANGDGRYKCAIYPVRPLICRLQGLAEELPCPNVKAEPLKREDVRQLFRELGAIDARVRRGSK